jgi:hypothetical protein
MKIRTSVYAGALAVKRFVTITVAWILIIMTEIRIFRGGDYGRRLTPGA